MMKPEQIWEARASVLNGFIILVLLLVATALYYWGDLPALPAPEDWGSFLTGLAYHEVGFVLLAIPVVYASVVLRVRGAVLTSLAASLLISPHAVEFTSYTDPFFRLFSFAAISVLLGGLIGILLNARERLQEEHSSLERFISGTLDSQETEKKYLARELHDETAQRLVDIMHEIDEISERDGWLPAGSNEQLRGIRSSVEDVLESTRRFMQGLRPPQLDDLGLGPSLVWLGQQLQEESGIEVHVDLPDDVPELPPVSALVLYRVTQEALTNARRHGRASRIDVQVNVLDDEVEAQIRDDGAGFVPPRQSALSREGRFGLIGIFERARLAGGAARVDSAPGQGTRVTLRLPVAETAGQSLVPSVQEEGSRPDP